MALKFYCFGRHLIGNMYGTCFSFRTSHFYQENPFSLEDALVLVIFIFVFRMVGFCVLFLPFINWFHIKGTFGNDEGSPSLEETPLTEAFRISSR